MNPFQNVYVYNLKENLYPFVIMMRCLNIGEKSEIDFSKKTRTLQEIKNFRKYKIIGFTLHLFVKKSPINH